MVAYPTDCEEKIIEYSNLRFYGALGFNPKRRKICIIKSLHSNKNFRGRLWYRMVWPGRVW